MKIKGKIYQLSCYNKNEEEILQILGYPSETSKVASLEDISVEDLCENNQDIWVVTLDTDVNAEFEYNTDNSHRWILPDGSIDPCVYEVNNAVILDDAPSDSYAEIWWRDPEAWSEDF